MEQTTSQRTLADGADTSGSGTLPEDGHIVGITAKLGDVGLDPLQRLDLIQDTVVAGHTVRTLSGELAVRHEAEDAQTVVDGDEHHILRSPLLTVELRLSPPAFTIAATVNPQGHRQFLVCLTSCLRIDIQIETVLAVGSLVAVAPLSSITARIVNSLIAGMTELGTILHAFPRHHGLRLLPAQVADGRCSIGDAFVSKHTRNLGFDADNLTTLNGEHRTLGTLLILRAAHQQCHEWQQ